MAAPVLSAVDSREGRKSEMIANNISIKKPFDFMQTCGKFSGAELLNLSVEELAREFGCSRGHLSRLFQQHFGYSLTALRLEMRLLKAATLLREPGAAVGTVAERCGFNHPGLFSVCFQRRFGETPAKWSQGRAGLSDCQTARQQRLGSIIAALPG